MLNTKYNHKLEIMLYNYENGIKMKVKVANSIYTFSALTTYKKCTFFSVSIKNVIKIIKFKDKWRYREIIIHL